MTKYQAPTDFRAVRVQSDFVLSVSGCDFGTLVWCAQDDCFQFVTNYGYLREELLLDRRPLLIGKASADFAQGLRRIKAAYIVQDRQGFEEVQADQDAEARVAAHYEEGPAELRGYEA